MDGLVVDEPTADSKIMLPARLPDDPVAADVLMVTPAASMAVAPVPPLEINTDPPRACVLPAPVAWAEMVMPFNSMPQVATSDTGPATPLTALASVVMLPDTVRLLADVLADELTSMTSPPDCPPLVLIEPTLKFAAFVELPVEATT